MCFRYERVPLGLRCVPTKVLVMFYGFFLWLFHCLCSFFRSYKTTSWAMCIRISRKITTIIPFCHHCTTMLERTVPFFDRASSGSVFPPEAMCWSFDLLFQPCLQPTFLAIDPCRFLRAVGRKEKNKTHQLAKPREPTVRTHELVVERLRMNCRRKLGRVRSPVPAYRQRWGEKSFDQCRAQHRNVPSA